jgi:hypothetical protein
VLLIVLVVLFTMAMFLWGLAVFGPDSGLSSKSGICAWIAVLILGVTVYLLGAGVVAWQQAYR